MLVVDDDPASLQVTQAHLESAGYDVIIRNDAIGTSAFILREAPDVVVLDVDMPGLRGDRIAELLSRGSGKTPSLIFYSVMDEAPLKAIAERCGAAHVTKTGLIGDLVRAIDRALGKRTPSDAETTDEAESTNVLDPDVVAELSSLASPKRPGFLRKVADAYIRDARVQTETLSKSLQEGDFPTAIASAHRLKGSSQNVGAKRLGESCASLEQLARASDAAGAMKQLDRVREQLVNVERALEALAAKSP